MRQDVDCLVKALQLQHTRCGVYQKWDAKFRCALTGALSLADFQLELGDTIVVTFRQVSSSLRQLQDACREAGGEQNSFLASWIDRVQQLEQEHYRVSVELLQLIAQHCTSVSLSGITEGDATTPAVDGIEVKNKPVAGNAAGDGRGAPPVANSGACASLHDAEHCALRRLIPVSHQTALTYVSCRDATSLCSLEEQEEEETNKRHCEMDDEDGDRVSLVLGSGVVAAYIPREVQQRCAAFNMAALPLWHTKRELQQKLHEQTEELQEVVSNSIASG